MTDSVLAIPAEVTLQAGGAVQLSVQANDSSGQPIGGARFRFSPADPKVLQVSDRGLITALGPATAQTHVVVASGRAELRVPVQVLPGPPQRIEKLGGDGQAVQAGETPQPISIRIRDAWGNPVPRVLMSLEGPATIAANGGLSSDADGLVHIKAPALTRAGTVVVAVHPQSSAAPVESFTLHVAPASPAKLERLPNPAVPGPAGDKPEGMKLLVTDSYGNPVPNVAVRARMSKSDKNPTLARSDNNGIAIVPLPRRSKARRVTLQVELADSPSIRASFAVD